MLIPLLLLLGATNPARATLEPIFDYGVLLQTSDPMLDNEGWPQTADLMLQDVSIGTAAFWNTQDTFVLDLNVGDGWQFSELQVYAGRDRPPTDGAADSPLPDLFPCIRELGTPSDSTQMCPGSRQRGITLGSAAAVRGQPRGLVDGEDMFILVDDLENI